MSKGAWNRYAAKGKRELRHIFPWSEIYDYGHPGSDSDSQLRELGSFNARRKRDRNTFYMARTFKSRRTDTPKAGTMGT
jgi:hypothetical protein